MDIRNKLQSETKTSDADASYCTEFNSDNDIKLETVKYDHSEQMTIIYYDDLNEKSKINIYDCRTLNCLQISEYPSVRELSRLKPDKAYTLSGDICPLKLSDGRYIINMYDFKVGSTRTCVMDPKQAHAFEPTKLTTGGLDYLVRSVSQDEIVIYTQINGLKIYKLNNLDTPYLYHSFIGAVPQSVFKINDKIYLAAFKNGLISFYQRDDKNLTPIGSKNLAEEYKHLSPNDFSFSQIGKYLIITIVSALSKEWVHRYILECKTRNEKVELVENCKIDPSISNFSGGYLLNTRFEKLIAVSYNTSGEQGGKDIVLMNPKSGQPRKIYSSKYPIGKICTIDHQFLSVRSLDKKHVELLKFESNELKNTLSTMIQSGFSFFPRPLAVLCADYVGHDITDDQLSEGDSNTLEASLEKAPGHIANP